MRTIVITGATTGIGRGIADVIPQQGDIVFLHYHANRQECEKIAADLTKRNVEAHVLQGDFATDPDGATRTIADRISEVTDHISILINNAGGIIERRTVAETDYKIVAGTVNLNLLAPMMLSTYLMPLLQKSAESAGRADVINITSIAARSGSPTSTPYGAAKAGLENFTRGFAKEVGPGIRVNSISPGVIDTPFHHGITPKDKMDGWLTATPVGHHGSPADIASAIRFVLENDFMSGAVVPVNGGIQMI